MDDQINDSIFILAPNHILRFCSGRACISLKCGRSIKLPGIFLFYKDHLLHNFIERKVIRQFMRPGFKLILHGQEINKLMPSLI